MHFVKAPSYGYRSFRFFVPGEFWANAGMKTKYTPASNTPTLPVQ